MEKLPDDAVVVLCVPTSEPHVEDVTVEHCHFCKQDVWFAGSTRKQIQTDDFYLVCTECWPKHIASHESFEMPTDEQIREVAKQKGVDFDFAKARIHAIVKARNTAAKAEMN